MNNIYFLGGSPCCGKSTIAEQISEKYGFKYYKADDYLEKYVEIGSDEGNDWLKYITTMSTDELWLRDPCVLHDEEFKTYEILFPYFISDLKNLCIDGSVIAEGVAFIPNLVDKLQINKKNYICIVPTKGFQIDKYNKRQWVEEYLSSCTDRIKAFSNWMERDFMFALSVLEQAEKIGYKTLVVDGGVSVKEILSIVERHFNL
jgi:2-phosphoglycerate kinase